MNKKKRFSGRGITGGSDSHGTLQRNMLNTTRIMYEVEKGTVNPMRLSNHHDDMIDRTTRTLTEEGKEFLTKIKELMPCVLQTERFNGEFIC